MRDDHYRRWTNRLWREQQERDDKTWMWFYGLAVVIFGILSAIFFGSR